jgi:hypothetical protein
MVRDIEQRKVIRSLGYLPSELIGKIVDTINDLLDDPNFNNWQ